MNVQVEAIYDGGVLRPLTPLELPDQARVTVTVASAAELESSIKAERQRAALAEMTRKVDALPQYRNNDSWSARNHDELLYGDGA